MDLTGRSLRIPGPIRLLQTPPGPRRSPPSLSAGAEPLSTLATLVELHAEDGVSLASLEASASRARLAAVPCAEPEARHLRRLRRRRRR
jgi:hypothetical protein